MNVMLTAGQMGDILAKSVPDRTAEFLSRQVRGFANAGLIAQGTVRLGKGRTAAIVYGETDLLAARIFTHLVSIGFTLDRLEDVRDVFANIDRLPAHGRGRGFRGLHSVADGVKIGELDWFLVLHVASDGTVGAGRWQRNNVAPPPSPFANACSVILIDVGRLCAGLFDSLAEGSADASDDD